MEMKSIVISAPLLEKWFIKKPETIVPSNAPIHIIEFIKAYNNFS